MPVIRLTLLLVVLAGLILLLSQNLSPVLPLVFLGIRTQALPLAVWILTSVAVGVLTSLLVTSLFQMSNYFVAQQLKTRRRDFEPASVGSRSQRSAAPKATASEQPDKSSPPSEASDDWNMNATDEDWDFDGEPSKPQTPNQDNVRDSKTYETNTEPKSGYRSGSVYSYSYRQPENSSVGKTESIYDADYRVITPPFQQPDPVEDDDDWGFENDDDFDDEEPNARPKRQHP